MKRSSQRDPMTQWQGCYDQQWAGVLTSESMAHPAKFSRGLIERIYRHCLERGYLKRGDVVGDCFGGVGCGGVMASYAGLRWIGCELEPRFCGMAKANFELHRDHLNRLGFPQPEIIQGDSRQFDRLVGQACAVIASPPFATQQTGAGLAKPEARYKDGTRIGCNCGYQNAGDSLGQIGALPAGKVAGVISSPPFAGNPNNEGHSDKRGFEYTGKHNYTGKRCSVNRYSGERSDGNIEKLPPGDLAAVVSSPPYSDIAAGQGGLNTKPAKKPGQQAGRTASLPSQNADQRYGQTEGQISQLKPGDLSAVVSSPPYEEGLGHGGGQRNLPHDTRGTGQAMSDGYPSSPGQIGKLKGGELAGVVSSPPYAESLSARNNERKTDQGCNRPEYYSETPDKQIGCLWSGNGRRRGYPDTGETYWQAVRDVYAACWRAIKPGGVMVLVTKAYVKNRKIVPLSDDTVTLCESLGFRLIERIQAMLVSETRHPDLFNGEDVKTKSRKSFFRRLAESKGSPAIDHEDVLIFSR